MTMLQHGWRSCEAPTRRVREHDGNEVKAGAVEGAKAYELAREVGG